LSSIINSSNSSEFFQGGKPPRTVSQSAMKTGNGANTIKELEWEADIDPNTIKKQPDVLFDADVDTGPDTHAQLRVVTVKEVHQNSSHKIKFKKTAFEPDIPTAVADAEKSSLDTWIKSLCKQKALNRTANELKFEITGSATGDGATRMARVKAATGSEVGVPYVWRLIVPTFDK
jgi:hypothetical protein